MAAPIIWMGSGSNPIGKTPLGLYESDAQFIADAPKIADWAARRLGYPVMDVELSDYQFYACFEEAVNELNAQVNQFTVRENMLSMQGSSLRVGGSTYLNYTNMVPPVGLNRIIEIADTYGAEAEVGGTVTWKKGMIECQPYSQSYDLNALWSEVSESGNKMEIKRIYHYEPIAFGYGLASAFNSVGVLGSAGAGSSVGTLSEFGWEGLVPSLATGISYTVMPVYEDLLRMQAVEFNNQIRRSGFGYELRNNKLTISPIPSRKINLYFDYILTDDRMRGTTLPPSGSQAYEIYSSSLSSGVVSNIGNATMNNMLYSTINDSGKTWIRKYTLAMAKLTLGDIREKYQTIPIPGSELTLNGAALKQDGQAEREALITTLREDLERTSITTQLDLKKQQAESIQGTLKFVPMYIYVGILTCVFLISNAFINII